MSKKKPSMRSLLADVEARLPVGDWSTGDSDAAVEWLCCEARKLLSERLPCDEVDWVWLGQLMLALDKPNHLKVQGMFADAVGELPEDIYHEVLQAVKNVLDTRLHHKQVESGRRIGKSSTNKHSSPKLEYSPLVAAVQNWYVEQDFDEGISWANKHARLVDHWNEPEFERHWERQSNDAMRATPIAESTLRGYVRLMSKKASSA